MFVTFSFALLRFPSLLPNAECGASISIGLHISPELRPFLDSFAIHEKIKVKFVSRLRSHCIQSHMAIEALVPQNTRPKHIQRRLKQK